jgi:hypothetical protein
VFFALALSVGGFVLKQPREAVGATIVLLGSFWVIASPYVAYLHKETGSFRLEGKWNINYTSAQRMFSGMGLHEARYGLDDELNVEGPLLPTD